MPASTPPRLPRRTLLALVLAGFTQAGTAAPPVALGAFALLGDGVQVVVPGEAIGTRLDTAQRESLNATNLGLDQAALRAVRDTLARDRPAATLHMYRSPAPLSLPEQRTLSAGAANAELPAWMVQAIERDRLTHLLIVTRSRGDAAFRVANGFTLGTTRVEGVGFYADTTTEVMNRDNGQPSTGFLGAYAMLRLQLMDARSGEMLASHDLQHGEIYAGNRGAQGWAIWNDLDANQKVAILRALVQREVARVLPPMLAKL